MSVPPLIRRLIRKVLRALQARRRRVYWGLGALVVAAFVAAVATRSVLVLAMAVLFLTGTVAAFLVEMRRVPRRLARAEHEVKRLRAEAAEMRRVQHEVKRLRAETVEMQRVQHEVKRLRAETVEMRRAQHALAVLQYERGTATEPPGSALPRPFVVEVALDLLTEGDALGAYAWLVSGQALKSFGRTPLRRLRGELRHRGYPVKALEVARVVKSSGENEQDVHVRRLLQGEIAVLSGECVPSVRVEGGFEARPGRVLHIVGNALPGKQSGYTLRTHYTALAQRAVGLDPHVVTQMGFDNDGDEYVREELDGVTYHRIPGPARGTVPLDGWLRGNAQRVANVVRVVRPAVLHAASDFFNAVTAQVVGREFGIPVVYESRGFWEETWLSRQAQTFGWDLARLEARHGLPDVYRWRREIEDRCRRDAQHVVTLAEGMADRIEAGGVPRDRITVVPNGVDVDSFPVVTRNEPLAASLGIGEDTTVVGYISSLVEYEGIDTLLAAYKQVEAAASAPVALLIVGDGLERERLERQAAALGLRQAIFTGRVAHDAVLDYYSLIDVFVVPRKPVEVCHLVTPLKPFEAFATGRTVVLSNVRALARIAEQSHAAELFEAGNAQSLAEVLGKLLADPQRCRDLAEAGAQWVRAERTWTANASVYVELYRRIAKVEPDVAVVEPEPTPVRPDPTTVNVDALRRALAGREPIPLEVLSADDARGGADHIMTDGWSYGGHPLIRIDADLDWTTACMENRSWNFHLHAWDFMGPVLRAHVKTGERRYLEWCVERAVGWAHVFNDADDRGTMAWYDMALGLRGHRLAYLLEQTVLGGFDRETVAVLVACVARHQQEFLADDAFAAHSNHGVYVAMGELALSRRLPDFPGMKALHIQGRERMDLMARTQFATDGGHLEHSPDYHRMLLASFRGAIDAGLIEEEEVRHRLALAEDALGWFVQPNGELVQVGDTPAQKMTGGRASSTSPTTQFLLSRGRRGVPNERELHVLPEAGYAIVRSPQPAGTDDHTRSSYLFLSAAFHSRTHKHADDLTFTWYDRAQEILIDAGRYGYVDLLPKDSPLRREGYYYSAPERQYAEVTRAHNTVEVDGRDHVRRGRQPYGSAIRAAEKRDGHFVLRAEVDHGFWHHDRAIVLRPGQWLYVVDTVEARDGLDHDFRAWWNLAGDVTPRPDDRGRLAVELPGSADPLWIAELGGSELMGPVTGQREPMRGWRSKRDLQLTPAWSTGFVVAGTRRHQFQTLFSFGAQPSAEPPAVGAALLKSD